MWPACQTLEARCHGLQESETEDAKGQSENKAARCARRPVQTTVVSLLTWVLGPTSMAAQEQSTERERIQRTTIIHIFNNSSSVTKDEGRHERSTAVAAAQSRPRSPWIAHPALESADVRKDGL